MIPATLPFMGRCFGASLNLITAVQAGVAGILLAALYLVLNVPLMLFADKALSRRRQSQICATAKG